MGMGNDPELLNDLVVPSKLPRGLDPVLQQLALTRVGQAILGVPNVFSRAASMLKRKSHVNLLRLLGFLQLRPHPILPLAIIGSLSAVDSNAELRKVCCRLLRVYKAANQVGTRQWYCPLVLLLLLVSFHLLLFCLARRPPRRRGLCVSPMATKIVGVMPNVDVGRPCIDRTGPHSPVWRLLSSSVQCKATCVLFSRLARIYWSFNTGPRTVELMATGTSRPCANRTAPPCSRDQTRSCKEPEIMARRYSKASPGIYPCSCYILR